MPRRLSLPNSIALVDALARLRYSVSSPESVATFLLDSSPSKPSVDRILSWMISLGLLRPQRFTWAQNLYEMVRAYFSFPLIQKGTWQISDSVASALRESTVWFNSLFESVTEIGTLRSVRVPRLCALLMAQKPECDGGRVVYVMAVCFGVAARFCEAAGFSDDFAEGVAFYLGRAIGEVTERLPSVIPDRQWQYFARVSSLIYTVSTRNWRFLDVNGVGFDFAKAYEGALFARQISRFEDVLVLWDQIFARLAILPEFVTAVTVTAIDILTIPEDEVNVAGLVMRQKDWNVARVVGDALKRLEHRKSAKERLCARICPWVPGWHGWSIKE
jgi:hypothetical protein